MLTKENLIDAYEQGLSINTRNGNIKIVCILGDVYGVNHCDTNSKLVKWWMFENFERNQATIEQPKPKIDLSILKEGEIYYMETKHKWLILLGKFDNNNIAGHTVYLEDNTIDNRLFYKLSDIINIVIATEEQKKLFYSKFPYLKPKKYNGRAVKCDTVEQANYVIKHLGKNYELYANNCINLKSGEHAHENFYIDKNYEIISFSQYCQEQGIKKPIFIQGFEVKDGYNDVVMVSQDNIEWKIDRLHYINSDDIYLFKCDNNNWKYCRYPRKEEINEIKFSN